MDNTMLLIILIVVVLLFLVIGAILIVNNKEKSKYKEEIKNLDIEKNHLIGVPILSELSKVKELVKTDNLKNKLDYWDNEFKDIKENRIDVLNDLITDADFLIDRKDYKDAVKKIAYIEIELEELRDKTKSLLEEIKVITTSEERNRSIITKLKIVYREIQNKFERTSKDYGEVGESITKEFHSIDNKIKSFEKAMDNNDYILVEKIVEELETEINTLKKVIDEGSSIILMATTLVNNKIDEVNTMYYRMQRDGYPLDYLNIEYNISEIRKKCQNIIENLKKFEIGDASLELKTMLDYLNSIFTSFDKEKESKDTFRENCKVLKYKLENINKVVYDIYIQMDDIKKTYDLKDEEINKFSILNKSLEQINADYKILIEQSKMHTFAYSKLVEELDGLERKLTRLQDDLDFRLQSITSMQDDENRAKDQLETIQNLLKQSKNKIRDNKIPVIPNSYFIELREAQEAIREIIKELNKKPIVIKILNIRVDTARDLVFKIYNKTNDMVKLVNLNEKLIVYANRYCAISKDIDDGVMEASELFNKGQYRQSIDILTSLLNKVDPTYVYRFGLEKEE